jgi:hypothetical protein
MVNPEQAGSDGLCLRIGAFGVLYGGLASSFTPLAAFTLALVASIVLARA